MPSVFLSHSSRDKEFVRKLTDHLEQRGSCQVSDVRGHGWKYRRYLSPAKSVYRTGSNCKSTAGIFTPSGIPTVRDHWVAINPRIGSHASVVGWEKDVLML